ncbi:hypothetical protein B0H11DRAFT_1898126 [Mycena galericulata]|nr:hypothetical protein B0H11DRAFT_1898126 [Mycena galericulata]
MRQRPAICLSVVTASDLCSESRLPWLLVDRRAYERSTTSIYGPDSKYAVNFARRLLVFIFLGSTRGKQGRKPRFKPGGGGGRGANAGGTGKSPRFNFSIFKNKRLRRETVSQTATKTYIQVDSTGGGQGGPGGNGGCAELESGRIFNALIEYLLREAVNNAQDRADNAGDGVPQATTHYPCGADNTAVPELKRVGTVTLTQSAWQELMAPILPNGHSCKLGSTCPITTLINFKLCSDSLNRSISADTPIEIFIQAAPDIKLHQVMPPESANNAKDRGDDGATRATTQYPSGADNMAAPEPMPHERANNAEDGANDAGDGATRATTQYPSEGIGTGGVDGGNDQAQPPNVVLTGDIIGTEAQEALVASATRAVRAGKGSSGRATKSKPTLSPGTNTN